MKTVLRVARAIALAIVVAALVEACNADSSGGSAGSGTEQAYESSVRRQLELVCSCGDEKLCVEAGLNAWLDGCVRDVLAKADGVESTLECLRQATEAETACIRSDPCDTDLRDECYSEWVDDSDHCPSWPSDVQNDIDDCPRLFECVDGGTVDSDLVCDGSEDCDDGSDEIPC